VQKAQSARLSLIMVKQSFLMLTGSVPDLAAALSSSANGSLKSCLAAGYCPAEEQPLILKFPGRADPFVGSRSAPSMVNESGASCSSLATRGCNYALHATYQGICSSGTSACAQTRFIEIILRYRVVKKEAGVASLGSDLELARMVVPLNVLKEHLSAGISPVNACSEGSLWVGTLCVKNECLAMPR
jgi:hypothetical protein